MMDPCETYVKEAKRNIGLFKKNLWTAGLFYLNAAECYHTNGNNSKAFKYVMEAIKLLEKYWNKVNDVVLPDLEKALGLAFVVAPKNKKQKIAKKAYEVYVFHAQKLESAGNYLGAAEKYESAIQFAFDANLAKQTILRAIAVLEKALEKPHIIKKKNLREKIEEKLDYLKNLLPEEPEKVEIEKVTKKLSLLAEMDVVPEDVKESLQRIKSSLTLPVKDFSIDEVDRKMKIEIEFTRYSTFAEIVCEKNICTTKIFASNITGIVLTWGDILYHLEKENVLNSVLDINFDGEIKNEHLKAVIKYIQKKVTMKFEARKIASWLEALIVFLEMNKKLKKFVDEAYKIVDDLKNVYVFDAELLPADVKILQDFLNQVLEELR